MPKPAIDIQGDERVFLAGMTGSGKTYLTMHLIAPLPRVVVIDLKRSEEIGKWEWAAPDRESERRLMTGRAVRVRVQEDTDALKWLGLAYAAGGCVVYIDEIYALVPPGARAPDELTAIWTRGRELGIGGWAATQRPTWVPIQIMSEAEWSFCFRLKWGDDRKKLAPIIGEEVLEPITDEHGFWVSRVNWERPLYYPGLSTSTQLREVQHANA